MIMKKKWYRSGMVKTAAVLVGITSLAAAAAGGTSAAGIMSEGIMPFDNSTYLESRSFENSMYNYGWEVLAAVANKHYLEGSEESDVVDLDEILRDEKPSNENTSGLAYKISDLEEWVQISGWDAYEEDILLGIKADGSLEYMYYEDFARRVREGELEFLTDQGTYSSYDETMEYAEDQAPTVTGKADAAAAEAVLFALKNNQYYSSYYGDARDYYGDNVGIKSSGVLAVVDSRDATVYSNVLNAETEYQIKEEFQPVGAGSILDVVNEEPQWEGRLDDAYEALQKALTTVQAARSAENMLDTSYAEGETNFNYFFAVDMDFKGEWWETNTGISDYRKVEEALKEGTNPYVIVRPSTEDCSSNMDFMSAAEFTPWQHMVDNVGLDDGDRKDYIFAAWVDKEFPAQDLMAEDAENFEKYSGWLTPSIAVAAAGAFLFLLCLIILTAGAGRNNHSEEIRLNFYDRIYTEIGAGIVVCVWAVPTWMILGLGINIDYVDKLKFIVLLMTALAAWTGLLFIGGWLSLVRRIKAKTLWKNSLFRLIWRLFFRFFRKICSLCGRSLEFFAENTAGRIKMALLFTGFCFLQFMLCAMIFSGGIVLLFLLGVLDLAGLIYFLGKARGRELILDGLKRITDGDLQYKIPLDKLTGEQKRIADLINRIGEGLDAAVEKNMKDERMKTELITNVSHDLKTPLTSIINYVDLLKRENPQDPKIQGYLSILDEKSQRLKTLTEDVVEASKVSTGNISLEMTDLNFVELVHQVIGEFEERFRERNLSMMIHFDQEEAIICADGRRMWRVLENIFANTAKYAMENTRVYAEIKVNRSKVVFSLKNISAQPLNISADELTERFIRGDVSRNTEGSGLGLSIAKSLTELQGGEFKLYLDGDLFKVTIVFTVKENNPEQNGEKI